MAPCRTIEIGTEYGVGIPSISCLHNEDAPGLAFPVSSRDFTIPRTALLGMKMMHEESSFFSLPSLRLCGEIGLAISGGTVCSG